MLHELLQQIEGTQTTTCKMHDLMDQIDIYDPNFSWVYYYNYYSNGMVPMIQGADAQFSLKWLHYSGKKTYNFRAASSLDKARLFSCNLTHSVVFLHNSLVFCCMFCCVF